MDWDIKMYNPETEFEKGKYSKLIEHIRELDRKKLPEEAEDKVRSEICNIPFKTPFSMRIKNFFYERHFVGIPFNYKTSIIMAIIAVSISLIVYLVFFGYNNKQIPGEGNKIFTQRNNSNDTEIISEKLITETDISKQENDYLKIITLDVKRQFNYRTFSVDENTIKNILKSKEFKRTIDNLGKKLNSERDTIDAIIRIIKTHE
jgi:uncharacterized membrane protein